jgi:hypothetical protein
VGQYTSLVLDSSGNPHISYYDRSNGDLKYVSGAQPTNAIYAPVLKLRTSQ